MAANNCCNINIRVNHLHSSSVTTKLLKSLRSYYEWGMLNAGNFTNIGDTNVSGYSVILREAEYRPGYTDGTVFESFRKDWVWEREASYTDKSSGVHSPLIPSIYINGSLEPSGNYTLNYPEGRVIFNSPPGGEVRAKYSFKNVQLYIADDVPWYRELQFRSWNIEDNHFQRCADRGDWTVGGHHRMQMPTVVISPVGEGKITPLGLGDVKFYREQRVAFHIFAETACLRDSLVDLFVLNDETCVQIFDCDQITVDGSGSLDCNGAINSGLTYPDFCNMWEWSCARSERSNVINLESWNCGFFEGEVHVTFKILVNTSLI